MSAESIDAAQAAIRKHFDQLQRTVTGYSSNLTSVMHAALAKHFQETCHAVCEDVHAAVDAEYAPAPFTPAPVGSHDPGAIVAVGAGKATPQSEEAVNRKRRELGLDS
jgi:hypothetical protein